MKHTADKTLDKVNAIWDTRMQELVSGFTFLCSLVLLGYVCEKLHDPIKNLTNQLKYIFIMHNWKYRCDKHPPKESAQWIKIQDFGRNNDFIVSWFSNIWPFKVIVILLGEVIFVKYFVLFVVGRLFVSNIWLFLGSVVVRLLETIWTARVFFRPIVLMVGTTACS